MKEKHKKHNIFQFHFGTIKSVARKKQPFVGKVFQFHFGTIKRFLKRWLSETPYLISIPLWYD